MTPNGGDGTMSVNRYKNITWDLASGGKAGVRNADVHAALLMDIRDELQQLNRSLGRDNYYKLKILTRIDKRLRDKFTLAKRAKSFRW